jgi:hypothetical protein
MYIKFKCILTISVQSVALNFRVKEDSNLLRQNTVRIINHLTIKKRNNSEEWIFTSACVRT